MKLLNKDGAVIAESPSFEWVESQQGWKGKDNLYLDPERDFTVTVDKVGPIHFQMLFQPAEMVAAETLKATDKVLASFWKLIDDPRTDTVDLSLIGVQNAIEYTLTAVKAAGVPLDVQARKAEILTGILL